GVHGSLRHNVFFLGGCGRRDLTSYLVVCIISVTVSHLCTIPSSLFYQGWHHHLRQDTTVCSVVNRKPKVGFLSVFADRKPTFSTFGLFAKNRPEPTDIFGFHRITGRFRFRFASISLKKRPKPTDFSVNNRKTDRAIFRFGSQPCPCGYIRNGVLLLAEDVVLSCVGCVGNTLLLKQQFEYMGEACRYPLR
ncbi:unnamed protein product, partial [Laminaria digitata]